MRASEKCAQCRKQGFPFSRPNRLLIPVPEPLFKKQFAEEMNSPIL
jgi:hypothetical protein